ncbi:PAS domain S-box protein [Pseudanabaena sp. ABRG5-3]|uniref:PAS domain S-box protein n=1 Tax=Pseudanabaena sp. ABRG5-3 TaxID=685565 RepID=UPI000DC6E729|nr:PAS domain S-box protein [Pseudanabaena sp. ABRG5-3]BBC22610.1 two-component hybrid sensor and regulator [Pseudanabaena sp. ABRG5-3]
MHDRDYKSLRPVSNNLDWINDKSPITIAAHTTVLQAISLMDQAQSGCVLAMEGETLVGILTEQDIVQLCAAGINLGEIKIAEVMQPSPVTILRSQIRKPDEVTALLHKHQINYLPVLDDKGYPIGVITTKTLLTAITKELASRKISEQKNQRLHEKIIAKIIQKNRDLRQTEQRFSFALQNAPIVVFHQDRDLRYTWIYNPALGYKANEVIGKLDSDIITDEAARQLTEIKQRVLDTGIRERHEVAIPTEQVTQYYDLTVEPLLDKSGVVIGVSCAALDISNIKQAQVKLEESQYFTQRIVDVSPDIIYIYDLQESRNVYVNSAISSILGYTSDDLQAIDSDLFSIIIHPDDVKKVIELQKKFDTAKDGTIIEIEYRARHANGEWRWLYDRSSVFARDANGKVKQTVGNAQNITKRKLAEQRLKEIEIQQRTILEHLPVGVIITEGADQKMRYYNPYFKQLFGYSFSEVSTFEKWLPLAYPDPEYREWVVTTIHQQLAEAFAEQRDPEPIELRITAKDGSIKHVSVYCTIIDELHFITFVDLTNHYQTAIALQESEQHLQTIVSQSSDGIVILNQEGKIVFANPAAEKIFNLHIGELKDVELGIPITIDRPFEMDFLTNKGKIKIAEVLVTQIEWDNQMSYLTSIRDITDRKQVEEKLLLANTELIRATRLKDEFLANMSHELRTPLNAILGMSESLQDEILGELNDRQKKSIATIERSGYHLLELINDILDLAKIEAGKLELHTQNNSAQSICNDSLTFVKQIALKKNVQLITQIPSTPLSICVDELRIRQALINLLTNAVKFTPEGGSVTLAVTTHHIENLDETPQDFIDFSVIDTGIGIDQKDMGKLFQTFVQIDSDLNRKYTGTGLGLALVKRIAELHYGKVMLESKINEGSKFTIRLPYDQHQNDLFQSSLLEEQSAILTPSLPLTPTELQTSQLILIVDDNEANISSMWDYLKSRGYRLIAAKDGEAAVGLANSEKPNLILMDIQMPKMDGLEAIRIIRTNPDLVSTPIIALTALAMSGDRERCLQVGANDYLTKPVKLKHLSETIQKLLSS